MMASRKHDPGMSSRRLLLRRAAVFCISFVVFLAVTAPPAIEAAPRKPIPVPPEPGWPEDIQYLATPSASESCGELEPSLGEDEGSARIDPIWIAMLRIAFLPCCDLPTRFERP